MASRSQPSGAREPISRAAPAAEPSASYTPGPWRITHEDAPNFHVTAADATLPDPWEDPWNIAIVVGSCGYKDDPRTGSSLANARLIAAAPKLYEALRDILEGFDVGVTLHAHLAAARAALAEAQGLTDCGEAVTADAPREEPQ
jgi:hypothetical protein